MKWVDGLVILITLLIFLIGGGIWINMKAEEVSVNGVYDLRNHNTSTPRTFEYMVKHTD